MPSPLEQLAQELLTITLRRTGIAFGDADQQRLTGELARFLEEGQMISAAVPASLEPQTVVVFEDGTDAV